MFVTIPDAESKLQTYRKEKEYLESQMTGNRSTVFDNEGKEIIEEYTEEEDKAWRLKHRENIKKYKQGQAKTEETSIIEVTDEQLWYRLEELELEEELANELNRNEGGIEERNEENLFIVKEESSLLSSKGKDNVCSTDANIRDDEGKNDNKIDAKLKNSTETHSTDILQKVLEKQYELENKLTELKSREKPKSKTESDLISKLDELEQLDELEDEIDRLDDMLQNRGQDENEKSLTKQNYEDAKPKSGKLKKSISFADEDDGETLELQFKHSEIKPNLDPYDPKKGITKPSDIYIAYSSLFDQKPSSILKKSKYDDDTDLQEKPKVKTVGFTTIANSEEDFEEDVPRTIVVKDVVEKSVTVEKKVEMGARPTSLFQKKRMQNKLCEK